MNARRAAKNGDRGRMPRGLRHGACQGSKKNKKRVMVRRARIAGRAVQA